MNDQLMRELEAMQSSIERNINDGSSSSPLPATPPTTPRQNMATSQGTPALATLTQETPNASHEGSLIQLLEISGLASGGLSVIATQGESWSRGTGRRPFSKQYQLQLWAYEILNRNLTFSERLEKTKWEDCGLSV